MNVRKRQSYNTKGMTDKADCQKWHFLKRIRERYGIYFGEERYVQIVNSIRSERCAEEKGIEVRFVKKQSWRVDEYEVILPEVKELINFYKTLALLSLSQCDILTLCVDLIESLIKNDVQSVISQVPELELLMEIEELPISFTACYDHQRRQIITALFPLDEGLFTVHQFIDYFGNTVSTRTEYGKYFEININTKTLQIPSTDTELVSANEEIIQWKSEDKKLWTWNRQMEQLSMELNVEW